MLYPFQVHKNLLWNPIFFSYQSLALFNLSKQLAIRNVIPCILHMLMARKIIIHLAVKALHYTPTTLFDLAYDVALRLTGLSGSLFLFITKPIYLPWHYIEKAGYEGFIRLRSYLARLSSFTSSCFCSSYLENKKN